MVVVGATGVRSVLAGGGGILLVESGGTDDVSQAQEVLGGGPQFFREAQQEPQAHALELPGLQPRELTLGNPEGTGQLTLAQAQTFPTLAQASPDAMLVLGRIPHNLAHLGSSLPGGVAGQDTSMPRMLQWVQNYLKLPIGYFR
jgi:hypothetical protein